LKVVGSDRPARRREKRPGERVLDANVGLERLSAVRRPSKVELDGWVREQFRLAEHPLGDAEFENGCAEIPVVTEREGDGIGGPERRRDRSVSRRATGEGGAPRWGRNRRPHVYF
jgi:hypothetical protein